MRGKRAKQYRKLMHRYGISFGFREPYQTLVDADLVTDCARFKMDISLLLERTLQGKVKPMMTQCSMRHLYKSGDQSNIAIAKQFERRRCNHHELDEPLSTLDCFSEVVDPKGSGTNKHRYVVASQDKEVRAKMRKILGVPLVYVHRSVMIMEPMAEETEAVRDREERAKFRAGLKTETKAGVKRKREEKETEDDGGDDKYGADGSTAEKSEKPKKKKRGPKGPNPLSVMKSKKKQAQTEDLKSDRATESGGKRRRRRKRADGATADAGVEESTPAG